MIVMLGIREKFLMVKEVMLSIEVWIFKIIVVTGVMVIEALMIMKVMKVRIVMIIFRI